MGGWDLHLSPILSLPYITTHSMSHCLQATSEREGHHRPKLTWRTSWWQSWNGVWAALSLLTGVCLLPS